MTDIPLLLNHDPDKLIGIWRRNGIAEFNSEQRITKDMLFTMFGGAGIRILETYVVSDGDGIEYIKAFQILEFSLVSDRPSD